MLSQIVYIPFLFIKKNVSGEENRESLELIEKSLAVLCLDLKPIGEKFMRRGIERGAKGFIQNKRDETSMAHQMLHGGGSQSNTPNRWFDKTIQVSNILNLTLKKIWHFIIVRHYKSIVVSS